jgi:hypothetical protein
LRAKPGDTGAPPEKRYEDYERNVEYETLLHSLLAWRE